VAAYPELRTNRRTYTREQEAAAWQIERVTSYLGGWKWPRQVSQRGQISIYGKAYEVGRAQGGREVWLRFETTTLEWVIEDGEGYEIRRHAAQQITAERIGALEISKPHASGHRSQREKGERAKIPLRNAA
jgi:hypothetical protein